MSRFEARTIQQGDPARAVAQVRALFDAPPAVLSITHDQEGDSGPDFIEFTIQVRDRNDAPWPRIWPLLVYVAMSGEGAIVNPTPAVSFNAPNPAWSMVNTNNETVYLCLTDPSGEAKVGIEHAGPGSFFLRAAVLGMTEGSEGAVFT